MAFPARWDGTCSKCGGPFKKGDLINIYNLPRPKTPRHAVCPSKDTESTESTATAPESTEKAPESTTMAESTESTESTPPARKAGSLDDIIRDIVRGEIGTVKANQIDEDLVRVICREELERVALPVKIEITRVDGTKHTQEGGHYFLPRLLSLLAKGISVYLYGPAGTGKTTALTMAAEIIGCGYELDTWDPSTPKSAILGYRTPTGEAVETAATRAYALGRMHIADEMDNSPAHVQSIMNSALANGIMPAAWGGIQRSPGYLFCGAGNTPCRPTPAFPDRRPGSAAFLDRLYFMFWPLDPNIERRATGRPLVKTPKRAEGTCDAAEWGRWVEEIRAWASKNAPTLQVTPRATLTGLIALSAGETPAEVADGLVFRGADPGLVSKALEACPLPG